VGDRRIGVATSDTLGIIASPHTIIERTDDQADIQSILDIVSEKQVDRIVAGLPLSPDGGLGAQAQKVKSFIESLSELTPVPVEYRDERLSTVTAREIMKTSRSKKNRRKSHDDDVAAAVILQEYLDETRDENETGLS